MSRKHDVVTLSGDEVDDMRDAIESLTAERDKLAETLYYKTVTCTLAMKHRDEAEAELATLRAQVPAEQSLATIQDSHQPAIKESLTTDSARIPFSLPDAAVERIYDNARHLFRVHKSMVCGQQITQADSYEYHIINATLDELRDTIDKYAPIPAQEPSTAEETLLAATQYAHDLVIALHRDHYAANNTFEPFDDLLGLLSQIDNMICGWKEPAQVPDGYVLVPTQATDDMQDEMREALIDQGWCYDSASEVDFGGLWVAGVEGYLDLCAMLAAAQQDQPK